MSERDEKRFTQVNHGPTEAELDRMDELIASHYADEGDGMGASPRTVSLLGEAATATAQAIRAEARSAYLAGTPDKHHPDL